jgi:hypothetical protein
MHYYAVDATKAIRPITTKASYVPDLEPDFLAGRAPILSKFWIIMDEDK